MTIIVIGISFILIWLGTTFFLRHIKKLKDNLLDRFSDTEKLPEEKSEYEEYIAEQKLIKSFDYIKCADPENLLNSIQQEHPQIIALVLAYLEPGTASLILRNLPRELQSDVSRRIATLDRVSPEIIREIERVLEKKLATLSSEDYIAVDGVGSIVEILQLADRDSESQIIKALEDEDPELADEIKKRMFVFEDIVMLDDRFVQKVMREVDSQEMAKALKSVDTEVQDKVFRNMSKHAASILKEDMEYMGPVRLRDVEESQQKIVSIIRRLEDTGGSPKCLVSCLKLILKCHKTTKKENMQKNIK